MDSDAANVEASYEHAVGGGPRVMAQFRDGALTIGPSEGEAVDCCLRGDPVARLLALYGRASWEELLHMQRVKVVNGDAAVGDGFTQLFRNP